MQTLAGAAKGLIAELPAPETALPKSDAAFQGVTLEASLPFQASPISLKLVREFKRRLQAKQEADLRGRAENNALMNDRRCSEGPLLGKDAAAAVKAEG